MTSLAARLAALPEDQRAAMLATLRPEELQAMPYMWPIWARPDQLPPEGDWRTWLLLGGRGSGKLIDADEVVPVPSGWTKLRDIAVGDEVFDEAGRVCRVLATHDAMPDVAYHLTFSDSAGIDCCADHQWVTWTHAERKSLLRSPYDTHDRFPDNWPAWRRLHACGGATPRHNDTGPHVRTTQEIIDTLTYNDRGDVNHCIPVAGALDMPDRELPVDPYILGYWLGNGSTSDSAVTCGSYEGDEDWPHILSSFTAAGYEPVLRSPPAHAKQIRSLRMRHELRAAGIFNRKSVPGIYMRASARQRLALLRGLMDSDGYADEGSCVVEFSSKTQDLAAGVCELALSLGQKPALAAKVAKLYGRDCGLAYRVTWRPTIDVFTLPRKAERLTFPRGQSLRHHHRMIVGAERIDPVPMRCLTVDSPNSMFLVGPWLIPTHNTRSAAEWVREQAENGRRAQVGVIAPTADALRKINVEGVSGLLAVAPPWCRPVFSPATRTVTWPNGCVAHLFSAEEPDRLRGPNLDAAWVDELCAMNDPAHVMDMLSMALRLPGPQGDAPQVVISTTPQPLPVLKAIMAAPSTIITRARTRDNAANLDASTLKYLEDKYGGTTLGRQELDAEILDDVDGALWTRALLDGARVPAAPELRRVVVAVDPSGTRRGDVAGIVVAGKSADGHCYILADYSGKMSPDQWARKAVAAYGAHQADRIIAEANFGAEMVRQTIANVDRNAPVKLVHASRGKAVRAEPVVALYEQRKVHHVGVLQELESELCGWTPDGSAPSPGRLDALVWAVTDLALGAQAQPARWVRFDWMAR